MQPSFSVFSCEGLLRTRHAICKLFNRRGRPCAGSSLWNNEVRHVYKVRYGLWELFQVHWFDKVSVSCLLKTNLIKFYICTCGIQLVRQLHWSSLLYLFSDVLPVLDQMCSGRKSCEFLVFVAFLNYPNPCPEELRSYLEASFTCIPGEFPMHKSAIFVILLYIPVQLCHQVVFGRVIQNILQEWKYR